MVDRRNENDSELLLKFHKLEKECIGFENYVNASEENFVKTLEGLKALVSEIQSESIFSSNESLKELASENIKLLMVPYYEAETLFRIMDKREERVRMSHTFYLEYLKLCNHYELLEDLQKKAWKNLYNKFFKPKHEEEETE
jgi:hypothetical protein